MENNNKSSFTELYNEELDLLQIFNIAFKNKITIFLMTVFAAAFSVMYSLSLPNIYQSKVLVVSNDSNSNASSLSAYSGIASLAGVDLPVTETNNASTAVKKIVSLSFFENNFLPNIFLPNLMAIKSWKAEANEIEYDQKIYNEKTNLWVRKVSYPQKTIPSAQESFEVFINNHLSISEDKKTGFLTVAIKHQSPYVAKKWVELIIDQINLLYRDKDKKEAERAVNYLNDQITKTNYSEIKQVVTSILQQEMQKLTLIEANEFYVFEYINPPAVMEKKLEPSRAKICILGTLLGGFLSICFVLFRHFMFRRHTNV